MMSRLPSGSLTDCSNRFTSTGGAEERKHQEHAVSPAPLAQRPRETFSRGLDFPVRGWIKEAEKADGRVREKAQRLVPGSLPLRLQQVVQKVLGIREVSAELAEARSQELRHNEAIDPRQGDHNADHQAVVQNSDLMYPMEGDPLAAPSYWELALRTGGSFMSPSDDWP